MNTLEIVLNKRWILKSQDKELYYRVKDEIGGVKRFLTEKLGYQVIVNPYLIKVEKIPAAPQSFMGISQFNHKLQYAFLCVILMFLEDKEAEEQFVLSDLTEYIQSQYKEETVDWTSYTCRRHLIKTMKYCVDCGMLKIDDGSEESFAKDNTSEVLYENTGASRYFMRNFTKNVADYTGLKDFLEDEWIDMDGDRGIVRRQRVYRKLLMSMGMYRMGEEDEDFAYVKNYRNVLAGELEDYFDCQLQVHKTSAFLIMGENGNLGTCFPEENTLSDICLLCSCVYLEKIKSGEIPVPVDERVMLSKESFRQMVEEVKRRYGEGLIKSYREMTTSEFYREVKEYMEQRDFIEELLDQVWIKPVMGKITGIYPEDFKTTGGEEAKEDV